MKYAKIFTDYMDAKGVKYRETENQIDISYNAKNLPSIRVSVYFDKNDDGTAQFNVWNIMKIAEEDLPAAANACNALNAKYRWAKFYLDSDRQLTAESDAIVDEATCGEESLHLVETLVSITDKAIPLFKESMAGAPKEEKKDDSVFQEVFGKFAAGKGGSDEEISKDETLSTEAAPDDTLPAEETPVEPAETALPEIDELVGVGEFKAFCHDLNGRMIRAKRHNSGEVLRATAYVLFLGKGQDMETYAERLLGLFKKQGLLPDTAFVSSSPVAFPKWPLDNTGINNMEEAIEKAKSGNMLAPHVVPVNFDEWTAHTANPRFKRYLQAVASRKEKKDVYLFYCEQQSDKAMRRIVSDFRDIIATKSVCIPEPTEEELLLIAETKLKQYGYAFSETAASLFCDLMRSERNDGFFYGAKTAEKAANELIDVHESSGDAGDEITEADINALIAQNRQGTTAEKLLSRLYGMDAVKQQIFDVCNQIIFAREHNLKQPCFHMQFVGNPGTGKTTVARIVGLILKEAGALRVGNLYEHHARDLCGQYIGQTAILTKDACREAYGSVLFIDEAYSLYRGADNVKDFGREAIDTLIAEMENHADDLLVIFAGYPEEMETFINANPGLKSRIPYTVSFPNYTSDELFFIFKKIATMEFDCSEELLAAAKQHFDSLSETIKNDRSFGNARYVRNLYERTWGNAVRRAKETDEEAPTDVLLPEDFLRAVAELAPKTSSPDDKKPPKIGF